MRVFSLVGERYHDNGSVQMGVFSSLEAAQRCVDSLNFDYAVDFQYFMALEVELDKPESGIMHDLEMPAYLNDLIQ